MLNILIMGAVIALGVIIYSAWSSNSSNKETNQQHMQNGEKGCMWLFIFLAGIALVAIIRSCID